MFELAHGRDAVAILEECTGFEFYLTNVEAKFLVCFNHHDFLIAAGDAAPWLIALLNRRHVT